MRVDLLALEEARSHVPFLQHRDVRHVGELPVLSRQVEDALQRGQLAVDLAVRDLPLLPVFACAEHDHVSLRRFRMNVLTSAVVIVASRRPLKCGSRCRRIRRSSSSADRRPLTAYSVFRSSAASSKRIRFSFGFTGKPCAMSPSRIFSSWIASDSFVLPLDSRIGGRSGST